MTKQLRQVLDHIRRTALRTAQKAAPDAALLERFVLTRDEAAFEVLMRRHGPMVLAVCRRVLRNEADAEDAFQAVFLVLVRKAGTILPRSMVGNWLYGVAHTTALKAKAMNSKRRTKERAAGNRSQPETHPGDGDELFSLLDEELSRLPDKYRVPIVLCELEGKAIKDAAHWLGWPQGTLASRLSRGRAMLAKRLAHHGLTLPGGALIAGLAEGSASAMVPTALLTSTLQTAALVAAGQALSAGAISANVAALTEGMVKAMLVKKLKIAVALVLVIAVSITGAGLATRYAIGQNPAVTPGQTGSKGQEKTTPQKQQEGAEVRKQLDGITWHVVAIDKTKMTIDVNDSKKDTTSGQVWLGTSAVTLKPASSINVTTVNGKGPPFAYAGPLSIPTITMVALSGLPVRPDAQILVDGKKAKLGDLKAGMQVSLRWTAGRNTIAKIEARSPFHYRVDEIDHAKNTISITNIESQVKLEHLPLAKDAAITVANPFAMFSTTSGPKERLEPGMGISRLEFTIDADGRLVVKSITASK